MERLADPAVAALDAAGTPLGVLPKDSPARHAVAHLADYLLQA